MKRILVLGCTGMLGHKLFEGLSRNPALDVYATARTPSIAGKYFSKSLTQKVRQDVVDADNFDTVIRAMASIRPDIVINCIGLIKQLPLASDPLSAITVNSQLPHRLSMVCRTAGARMIHISTDCVFNGARGNYSEGEPSDAHDLYGRSKYLGEVEYPHCLTIRTSIIGHEFKGKLGLVEWFLAQKGPVKGFERAIYSGLTTIEMTRIINEYVIPNPDLNGVYHVSSVPVSKYDLLKLIAEKYGKNIEILRDREFVIDRSLRSERFRSITGYSPPSWTKLIEDMHHDYIDSTIYRSA